MSRVTGRWDQYEDNRAPIAGRLGRHRTGFCPASVTR